MAARESRQPASCFVCGRGDADREWFVLLLGRRTRLHCSSSCLAETVDRQRQRAAISFRRRVLMTLTLVLAATAVQVVRHYRAPAPEWISGDPPAALPEPTQPGPVPYGPAFGSAASAPSSAPSTQYPSGPKAITFGPANTTSDISAGRVPKMDPASWMLNSCRATRRRACLLS